MSTTRQTCQWPEPGTIVSCRVGLWNHKGIVSDRQIGGKPTVLANSMRSGGFIELTWDDFSGGQHVFLDGYPGQLPSWEVIHRARSLYDRKYDAIFWNCEHFVNVCHGLRPGSPQLIVTAVVALLLAMVLAGS
jgi:hypothetical protein